MFLPEFTWSEPKIVRLLEKKMELSRIYLAVLIALLSAYNLYAYFLLHFYQIPMYSEKIQFVLQVYLELKSRY